MDGTRTQDRGDELLEVNGVCVSFAGVQALDDVSLTLRRGEILGLIGANGAGKSTLVNVITGFQRLDAGRVLLDGQDITRLPPHRRARRGLARTFQAVRLFRRLTVEENIEAAAFGVGLRPREARRRTAEVLELTHLSEMASAPAGVLPYGDERRVALARALAVRPRYLAVDEPAAGLDEREGAALVELIASVRDSENLGVLLIDHDVGLVMRLADRVQVLADGRTICVDEPEAVQRNPEVISAYLGTRRATVSA
jgi:ABC-type branched-subunit amino acid transport system ATPase component